MNKLIICPDCGQETDSLVSSTKTCKLCYKRLQNAKTNGKPYIKLVDIQGTKEYNRAMGKRNATKKRKAENNNIRTTTVVIDDNIKSNTQNENLSDVNVIKTKILDMNVYDYVDIHPDDIYVAIKSLKSAMEQKDNIEKLVKILSEDLLVLSHEKENTNGPGDLNYDKLQKREFIMLKYRRQLKDILAYLNMLSVDIFSDNTKSIDDVKIKLDKNEYTPKYKVCNLYKVSVNVSGLHGSPKVESFERQVYSDSVDSAKNYVNDFLAKLKNIVVYGKTWEVKEVKRNVDIKKD